MEGKWEIEWAELRDVGGRYELFFVDATEASFGWCFRERSTWEVRRYDVSPGLRLVLIAEHVRDAINKGTANLTSTLYLVLVEDHQFFRFEICTDVNPVLARVRSWKGQTIVSQLRVRAFARLDSPVQRVYRTFAEDAAA
jgi:hypothetical protein